WNDLRAQIKSLGEGFPMRTAKGGLRFLVELNFVKDDKLTSTGGLLFEEMFIRKNLEREKEILLAALLDPPAVLALQQYLWGVEYPDINQVVTTLRTTGF